MSSLIKAADAAVVRRLDMTATGRPVAVLGDAPPARSALELALEEARDEIARLQASLLAAGDTHRAACDAAFDKGRDEGRRDAADDGERRFAALRDAGDQALAAWHARLAELDLLAASLARHALAKLFMPGADLADLTERAIAAKVGQLRDGSVIAIRVADEDVASICAARDGTRGVPVTVDPALAAGQCRIDLRLGEVDLSIAGIAAALDRFFHDVASER